MLLSFFVSLFTVIGTQEMCKGYQPIGKYTLLVKIHNTSLKTEVQVQNPEPRHFFILEEASFKTYS